MTAGTSFPAEDEGCAPTKAKSQILKTKDQMSKIGTIRKSGPFSSKETFVGVVAVLIIVCRVGLPIWSATQFIRDGSTSTSDAWTHLLSVFVALTTMTVSTIFLLMTSRIDRGSKSETRLVAKEVVEKIAEEAAEATEEIENEVKKVDRDQNKTLERINQLTDKNIHKQRIHSGKDPHDDWGWLRRCRKWLPGHICRNDENRWYGKREMNYERS